MTYSINQQLQILAAITACVLSLGACKSTEVLPKSPVISKASSSIDNVSLWPEPVSKVPKDPVMEQKIDALLAKMTLEQKVGQTIQPQIRSISLEEIKKYHIGTVLNGGGAYPNNNKFAKTQDWVALADSLYKASMEPAENGVVIPIMWGTDAVHGHNNVVGATLFPHNIAMGATHNPELVKKMGEVTAREIAATGINWSFAPTIAVVRDDRWGRTYESFSEDPAIVKAYAGKAVEGIQGEANTHDFLSATHVIATAKHFLGDGGTKNGINAGDTQGTEQELIAIHAQGYFTAIEAGAQAVMASFNSWNGTKMHGNKYLLTDILKGRMGFDGLVVGDWNGHEFVPGCTKSDCPNAFNAGVDIIMVVDDWKAYFENMVKEVNTGVISQARLDDAVRRILRVKMRAGLFETGLPSTHALAGKSEVIGSPEHRLIARQAVRESLILLKNKNHLLPLKAKSRILVAGDGADNIGKQAGGWSISWQGTGNVNSDFPGATSIYKGIKDAAKANGSKVRLSVDGTYKQKPDVAVVVFGENPYAEGQGDVSTLDYAPTKDLELMRKLKAQGIPVVSILISGRPLWINPELNASDAFVAAWLPGTEGEGIADVIIANKNNKPTVDFAGKLSFSWPAAPDQFALNKGQENYAPLFAYGFGLTYADNDSLDNNLSEAAQPVKQAAASLEIFKNRSIDPWQFTLKDAQNHFLPVTVSAASFGAIDFRTVDRNIQEDSLQLKWNGKAQASAGFYAQQPVDYSALPEQAALVFDVKVDKISAADVKVGMVCGQDCGATKTINARLQKIPQGQWQSVSVALSCFTKAGVKLEKLSSPFYLSSAGEVSLAVNHVRIESTVKPDVSCP